jgi:antitoxin PrlF
MSQSSRMDALVAGLKTKSDKIRALAKAGYKRQEIANYLGIRYQHVRNVEVQSGLDRNSFQESAGEWRDARPAKLDRLRLTIDSAGRIVIPAGFREAMGVEPGGELMARMVDGELRLLTPATAVKRAQKRVRELIPGDDSLADSLIAERRMEASREVAGG